MSIVARTALVLVAAVALALALAVFLFAGQRHEALSALGGRNAAERVAGMAHLLESTPPEARRATLHSMGTPGFRADWTAAPWVAEPEAGGLPAIVAHHLAQELPNRHIRVSTRPPVEQPGPGPRHMHGRHAHGGLHISVGLADGSWLNVAVPLEPWDSLFRPRFVLSLLLVVAVVTAAALWAVWRAARPFAGFAAAAERLGVDVAAPPMAETGPREVRQAAQAFNLMQRRIRRFVEDRTQMLAAISHDLRTPITRLKLRAEFVEDEGERARMLADLDEMERMIAATLSFARDDAAREPRRPVDVAAMLSGLVEDLAATGARASYEGPDRLVAEARPTALKRALANLLDNAVKYGGCARARLGGDGHNGIAITVEDDGPGIAEADRERAFAPFVRLEGSRSRETGGTGLGLAVARAAIRAHGGDITLANRPEGGLTVRVTLPVCGQPANAETAAAPVRRQLPAAAPWQQ